MILFVRQQAWLDAVPVSRLKNRGAAEQKKTPRYRTILANGGEPRLPNPGAAGYLIDYWKEAGCALMGGMGLLPLTSEEVVAWQNGSQIHLAPWEFQYMLECSRAYVGFLHQAEDPVCMPPFGTVTGLDKEKVANKLASVLDALTAPSRRRPDQPVVKKSRKKR